MNYIFPAVTDNPRGANPETSIYIAINKRFPQFGLTTVNSKIISTQPAATQANPYCKRVFIQKGTDPNDTYAFYYDCYDVETTFPVMVFNAEQLAHAKTLKNSAALITYIGEANNINMRPEDWWCSSTSIDYAGGANRPNFLLEAKSEAQWYTGWKIIHLWS